MDAVKKKRSGAVFGVLQRVGRAFMLPIALLPIAGLLLGIGSSFTNQTTVDTYSLGWLLGVVGALLLGMGMSLAMTEIGAVLGLSGDVAMVVGIPVGMIGIALVCVAYPVYNRILKKERDKIAPEIIRLTDELLK